MERSMRACERHSLAVLNWCAQRQPPSHWKHLRGCGHSSLSHRGDTVRLEIDQPEPEEDEFHLWDMELLNRAKVISEKRCKEMFLLMLLGLVVCARFVSSWHGS